jgi:hypothetical protein
MPPSVAKPFRAEDSSGGPLETEFILERLIGRAYTITLVKVGEVQAGGTGPVGFLSATDLIQQMDGNNQGIPNVPMENLPYFRLQGGANAIIIDPKPGDIGLAAFARRDITVTKQNKTEGPPPSLRTHDVSDGLYLGGLLNGAPSQWIQFLDSGIHIKATAAVTIDATLLQVNCPITSTGDITDHTSSMQDMRDQYNAHIGHTPTGGATPSVPME